VAEDKARELENFDTKKNLDIEGVSETDEEKEGRKVINQLLGEFAATNIEEMDNSELAHYITVLKQSIEGSTNSYIRSFVAKLNN